VFFLWCSGSSPNEGFPPKLPEDSPPQGVRTPPVLPRQWGCFRPFFIFSLADDFTRLVFFGGYLNLAPLCFFFVPPPKVPIPPWVPFFTSRLFFSFFGVCSSCLLLVGGSSPPPNRTIFILFFLQVLGKISTPPFFPVFLLWLRLCFFICGMDFFTLTFAPFSFSNTFLLAVRTENLFLIPLQRSGPPIPKLGSVFPGFYFWSALRLKSRRVPFQVYSSFGTFPRLPPFWTKCMTPGAVTYC